MLFYIHNLLGNLDYNKFIIYNELGYVNLI